MSRPIKVFVIDAIESVLMLNRGASFPSDPIITANMTAINSTVVYGLTYSLNMTAYASALLYS